MTISEYKLKSDFRAPKVVNLKEGEMQSYQTYSAGQTVTGFIDNSTGNQLLIVDNVYALPLSAIQYVRDIEIDGKAVDTKKSEQEEIKAEAKKKVEIPKEYREQMEKIKKTNVVESIVKKSRNSVHGLLIGGIVGLVGAIAFRQSKFMGIVLGATAGGLIGYGISTEVKKKQPEKKAETDGQKS